MRKLGITVLGLLFIGIIGCHKGRIGECKRLKTIYNDPDLENSSAIFVDGKTKESYHSKKEVIDRMEKIGCSKPK